MKNRHFKRLISLILAVVMLASMLPALPITVNAAETQTKTFTFSDYAAGTQYADNEVHKLDDNFTIVTTESHFTSELRIYSSSTHNGYAILKCTNNNGSITGLGMNAGNNVDTLDIYGSNDDGATWTSIGEVSVTSTSYKDYSITFNTAYEWIKLDVKGSNQVRIKNITVSYSITETETTEPETPEQTEEPTCEHTNKVAIGDAKDPTCTETGLTAGEKCADCGETITEQETIPANGHTYVDGVCSVCRATKTNYPVSPTEIKSNDRIVIVIQSGSTYYALSSSNGASKAPEAVEITISDETITSDVNDYIVWNIAYDNGNMTIYPKGTTAKWLYCTNSNDGVRVGTNDNKVFTIDSSSGYLKNTATSRYVGVYTTNPDWRCYTNTTGNIANQTIYFYKLVCVEHDLETVPAADKTCTTAGHNEYQRCKICGAEFNKTVIPASHTEVEIPGKEATCQETGLTDGIGCSQCDVIIKAQESIDMIPCSDGNNDDNCDSCGKPMCEHEWKNVGDSTATCESDGKQAQICSKCEREQEITVDALGHDTIDVAETPATCDTPGTTAGTKCQRDGCDYFTGMEEIPATGHNYVNGACSNCGRAKPFVDQYALVTDTNSLEVGDKIVIVAKDYNYALSTEQKTNNRGQIEITKDGTSLSINDSVQIITLGEGTVEGTFAFYTGEGYLYAASSNSNHLKTQSTNNDNGSWKIEISEDGVATIKAQGENTRNWLRYNQSSDLFSCYGSGQQDIVIYKLVEAPQVTNYNVSLNKGVTISVSYNVPSEWLAANEGATATFNGETVNLEAGINSFKVTLTPKRINDKLTLVIKNSADEALTSYDVSFSVYKTMIDSYSASALGISDAKYSALKTLLEAIVTYGNAATESLAENLGTETFEGVEDWSGTTDVYDIFGEISAELREEAAIHLSVKSDNLPTDGSVYTITVTRGETTLASGDITKYIVEGDKIIISSLFPADFNKEISITVTSGGEEVAQATFTFNEYLKAIYNSTEDTYLRNMIAATFRYGVAVDTYKTAQ